MHFLIMVCVFATAADAFSSPYQHVSSTRSFLQKKATASSYHASNLHRSPRIPIWTGRSSSRFASIDLQVDNDENDDSENGHIQPTSPFVGLPSYRRIIFFVATTVLIWISEPLLSLVDSAAVGRYAGKTAISTSSGPNFSSVVQLASLGPATMLCDSSIYLTFFIAMATTNKLATSFAKKDVEEQITTVSHVMAISLAVGALLCLIINLFGERLLSSILGPTGAIITIQSARGGEKVVDLTGQVLHAALAYARIRSAAYPLAVMGLTSQAALLCAGDTKTPVLAVLVASVTNIIGDYLFVAKLGFGVSGAALATSLASILSNSVLVSKLRKTVIGWKKSIQSKIPTQQTGKHISNLPFISFPERKSLSSLIRLAGPMFFVLCGKIIGYSAMTIRSGTFGLVSLACHNILMRIFFFFATIGDGISHSAQTFMPGLLYQKNQDEKQGLRSLNARYLLRRLILMSVVAGVVNGIFSKLIANNAGSAFTTDASLVSLMSEVSPFMGIALFIHPLTLAFEGSIVAGRNLKKLLGTYVFSVLLLLAQLKFACTEFVGVWHAIVLFQAVRILQFGPLVWKRTSSNV